MGDESTRGTLATVDDETPGFLCAVAAESVNDAILLLDGLKCEAEPHLQRAFEILVHDADAEGTRPDASQPPYGETPRNPKLSSTAIDLMIQQRLCEDEAQRTKLDTTKRGRRRIRAHVGSFTPQRQRAIMLMIEALSLLDEINDLDAVTHLQLAIDRAMDAGSQEVHGACTDDPSTPQRPN